LHLPYLLCCDHARDSPLGVGRALASDWNTAVGRDAARTGLSPDVGPAAPTILWQGGRPSVIAQQAVAAGNILVSNRMHNINDVQNGTLIVAQNLTSGAELWTANLPWDAQSPGWRNKVSAFRDGRIYATRAGNTLSDYLYALNPVDGSILWTSAAKVGEETTESLAFAENGDLVCGNFTSVMRIDHTDGSTVWSTPRSTPTSNGAQTAVYGNRVYLWEPSPTGPKVTAFDLTSGARLYSSLPIGGGFIQHSDSKSARTAPSTRRARRTTPAPTFSSPSTTWGTRSASGGGYRSDTFPSPRSGSGPTAASTAIRRPSSSCGSIRPTGA
jgi:outer membrane protein assembly factor BamB